MLIHNNPKLEWPWPINQKPSVKPFIFLIIILLPDDTVMKRFIFSCGISLSLFLTVSLCVSLSLCPKGAKLSCGWPSVCVSSRGVTTGKLETWCVFTKKSLWHGISFCFLGCPPPEADQAMTQEAHMVVCKDSPYVVQICAETSVVIIRSWRSVKSVIASSLHSFQPQRQIDAEVRDS